MKKIGTIAAVILVVIIAGIFLINEKEKDTEVTKKQTRVGFILNGSRQDRSWGQAGFEGMEKSAEKLNLKVFYEENVPEDENSLTVMENLIKEGCEIIICNSFGYGEWALEAARKYPKIYFFHATGVEEAKNMSTYFGRIYQMRYLSGIVAGMQTETNEIGYVAALPISEVNRGINAFTLGVREVNPEASVYVEWTNSWIDDKAAETAMQKLVREHDIDVAAMHTDSLKVLEIAEEKGIWSIGYNMDNSSQYPNTFLTAPVWRWENFYEPRILECLQGKFQGKHYWEGVETGVVDLAPLTGNVKEGIAEVVAKKREMLEKGSFDVFYGPIKDNQGKLRIEEGENMSDHAMLNEFDWYVEGVVTDMPEE